MFSQVDHSLTIPRGQRGKVKLTEGKGLFIDYEVHEAVEPREFLNGIEPPVSSSDFILFVQFQF